MSEESPSEHDAIAPVTLDTRLVRWLAIQLLEDRFARLVDGGADRDDRLELARLFVDLPVVVSEHGERTPTRAAPPSDPATEHEQAMPALLRGFVALADQGQRERTSSPRWLLVGGPGSGKSTLTRMVAQQLRRGWIEGQREELTPDLLEAWERANEPLAKLAHDEGWTAVDGALPLRVALPSLARWMASQGDPTELSLWDYLAHRITEDLDHAGLPTELCAPDVRELVEAAARVVWILDGLDEVPASAGRAELLELVRATIGDPDRCADGVLISTRPQGYEGEFCELGELELRPLPEPLALRYAERLLAAWDGHGAAEFTERRDLMRSEFAKTEVAELLRTPLHTTMAALLVANRGTLPRARSKLFAHYFEKILRRELDKSSEQGVRDEDEGIVRALHQRAGITLQVRSQAQAGARSSLRRRELRQMLAAIYIELGHDEDSARPQVDRIMRFAAERLVLLLHSVQGEYEFGIRSLQEFFAAQALFVGSDAVRGRLEAIVLDPHWSNVLAFVVSELALIQDPAQQGPALAATVDLCKSLNAGEIGGDAAARCFMGSRLALHMLEETEHYGHPWLHDPLWEVALEAVDSPCQRVLTFEWTPGTGAWMGEVEIHTRLGLLAARWPPQSKGDSYRRRLVEVAERMLAGDRDRVLGAWRLLHGSLLADLPEALALADANAPTERDVARSVVRDLIGEDLVLPPAWVDAFVDGHPEWFLGQPWGTRGQARVFEILRAISWGVSASTPLGSRVVICSVDTKTKRLERLVPDDPRWARWRELVEFLRAPSHLTLADLFDTVDSEAALEDLKYLRKLPWPARYCLYSAQTSADLAQISTKLREGRLGNLEAWRAAEARWRESPRISIGDVTAWLDTEAPWNQDIGSFGTLDPTFGLQYSNHTDDKAKFLDFLLARLDAASEPSRKEFALLRALTSSELAVPLRGVRLLRREPATPWALPGLASLTAGLTGPEAEGWFALLDERGREGAIRPHHQQDAALLATLIERMNAQPEQWGLLEVFGALVRPSTDLSEFAIPTLPDEVPPHIVATRTCLVLLAGRFDPAELPTLLEQLGEKLLDLVWHLRFSSDATAASILLGALDALPPNSETHRDMVLSALYAHLRHAASPAFTSPEAWTHHSLPSPYLELAPPPLPPPRILAITELSNIRLFKITPNVDVPFPTPPRDRGQWIVLVGENGVGKTTLLRALALAFASEPVASKLLDERLPMIRNGTEGRITIELDTGQLAIVLSRGQRTEFVESREPEAPRPWVVGYGVRRGNARGETDRDAEVGAFGELHSLFDRPASLHNAAQWLGDLEADVLREQRRTRAEDDAPPGPRERVWRSVQRALEALLGISKIEVDDGGLVHVRHPEFGRVRLDALSDGYLTTAGWVVDMIARWVDRQYELDEPIRHDLLRQICGFVLIDEIDLHLHPRWQIKIIEDIRRLFPRLSFVVTTHNPLTLQGARRGEVYVMRRDGEKIELVQHDVRPGHDVDRVLFEQFAVEHTFDRDTRELLAHHRELVERGVAPDEPGRAKLEAELRARFGDLGETISQERARAHGPATPLAPELRERFLARYGKKKA